MARMASWARSTVSTASSPSGSAKTNAHVAAVGQQIEVRLGAVAVRQPVPGQAQCPADLGGFFLVEGARHEDGLEDVRWLDAGVTRS